MFHIDFLLYLKLAQCIESCDNDLSSKIQMFTFSKLFLRYWALLLRSLQSYIQQIVHVSSKEIKHDFFELNSNFFPVTLPKLKYSVDCIQQRLNCMAVLFLVLYLDIFVIANNLFKIGSKLHYLVHLLVYGFNLKSKLSAKYDIILFFEISSIEAREITILL